MQTTLRVSTLSLALLFLVGCASHGVTKRDPRDPWEPMNRATYRFNDKFDRAIARFSAAYADQNEVDHERLADAVAANEVTALRGI